MKRAVRTVLALALLLSGPLVAQTMVIEADDGIEGWSSCQLKHVVASCDYVHIDTEVAPSVGGTVQLDGQPYIVEWMGPGYYLESGVIVQPTGATKRGLKRQRWLEVYPNQGRIHVSRAWKDVDGNRALSAFDTLALDSGRALTVIDVRLHVRVRPAPPEP